MVSGNRGIDYLIYMLSRDWQVTKKQRMLDYMRFGVYRQSDGFHLEDPKLFVLLQHETSNNAHNIYKKR